MDAGTSNRQGVDCGTTGGDDWADLIIIGGGCAGLSLAAHLGGHGHRAPKTIILEPRAAYSCDRTWSGWRVRPHLFDTCVRAHWDRWRLSAGGKSVEGSDALRRYETIEADSFYGRAQELIAGAAQIELLQGVTALQTGADAHGAWVTSTAGRFRARLVVDTRPFSPTPGQGLLQSFTGCVVETERPCFDPAVVDLMQFDPPSGNVISFMYGLPFSRQSALVELTRLGPAGTAAPDLSEVLARLDGRLGCAYQVRRVETGVLAMRPGAAPPLAHPRLLALGTRAGAGRAATGYAFATIQHHAETLASRIMAGPDAAIGWRPEALPGWLQAMDRLFLRVLRADPARAPALFLSLFEHCPPAPLTRFLSGAASLADAARVARALPTLPFLGAMMRGGPA